MKYLVSLIAVVLFACNSNPKEAEEKVVEGKVFFKNIADGDTLNSPFLMEMGVEGMEVEPKGPVNPGFGHHHLLVNDGALEEGLVIVADSTHIHYGGGQTSDSVNLAPGNYMLTLQFGDGEHVSFGEAWASSINVVVQ